MSRSSKVEWSLGKIEYEGLGTNYQLGTYHKDNLSPGIRNAKVGKPLGLIHSHPKQLLQLDKKESIGGDLSVGHTFLSHYGVNIPYIIHFPDNRSFVRLKMADPMFQTTYPVWNIRNYKF